MFTETCKGRTSYSNCGLYYGGRSSLDSNFLEFMDKGRYLGALCHLIKDYDLSPVLLATEPSASCVREKAQYLDETCIKNLVEKAWKVACKDHHNIGYDYGWFFLNHKEDDSWIADAMDTGHKYLCSALTKFGEFALWLKGEVADDVLRLAILNQLTKDYGETVNFRMGGVDVKLYDRIHLFLRKSKFDKD